MLSIMATHALRCTMVYTVLEGACCLCESMYGSRYLEGRCLATAYHGTEYMLGVFTTVWCHAHCTTWYYRCDAHAELVPATVYCYSLIHPKCVDDAWYAGTSCCYVVVLTVELISHSRYIWVSILTHNMSTQMVLCSMWVHVWIP